jgi:hypothetical protein
MSIDSDQTPFRPVRLIVAATAIARAISSTRLGFFRFASARRSLRLLWWSWEAPVCQFLNNPFAWTLIALTVSSIGLYCDLR